MENRKEAFLTLGLKRCRMTERRVSKLNVTDLLTAVLVSKFSGVL